MTQPPRPKGCPLFLHRNGQWCRKVKSKAFYFGTDLDAALKKWADQKDHLLAGYDPPKIDGKATIGELANLYLADSRLRVKSGDVRADHTTQCQTVLEIIVGAVGKHAKPDVMGPPQWAIVRQAIATTKAGKPAAKITLKVRLSRCRAFLNWCVVQKYVKALDIGGSLTPPAKHLVRREKSARGKREWNADDLRDTIDAAPVAFKAVLLLGINGGMGSLDIAELKRSQWKPGQEYLDCPRNKTGVERRVWLWEETREALAAAVAKRATPAKQKYDNRLLLSLRGVPWNRVESFGAVDVTKGPLATAKADACVTSGCFYDLRRTFRTQASEVCDLEATDFCMGHQGKGEGAGYVQHIADERVKRVCNHVRQWLYGAAVSQ